MEGEIGHRSSNGAKGDGNFRVLWRINSLSMLAYELYLMNTLVLVINNMNALEGR